MGPESVVIAGANPGWWAGLGIGFSVVAVVVVLVGLILMYASRIVGQARDGIGRMAEARDTTMSIWGLQEVNANATKIWQATQSATEVLKEKVR